MVKAEGVEFGDIKEFAGGTVGLCGVPLNVTGVADYIANGLRELLDGDIFAGADVY